MRCLYCGRQLGLFRKLTGGGEFCSEAHRQTYQDEYNRLALGRLMQTQNPLDEPPAAKLPPSSRKPQTRAGTMLDLRDVPPLSSHLPSEAGAERDAKRRAGFVRARQRGGPGVITARVQIGPVAAPADPEIGISTVGLADAAIRKPAERCLRLPLGTVQAPLAQIRTRDPELITYAVSPDLPGHEQDFTWEVLPKASRLRLKPAVFPGDPMPLRHTGVEQLFTAEAIVIPVLGSAPVELHVPLTPTPLQISMSAQFEEAQGCLADPVDFPAWFDFAETVVTGFVAGLKLGEEQIRFELPVSTAEAETTIEETHADEAAEEQVLPRDFIAAVQAIDASANGCAEAHSEARAPADVQRSTEPEPDAEPEPAMRRPRLCEWMPLQPAPVEPITRQRLMQTFQAVGCAADKPSAPDFGMLPMRPKFVVGRRSAAAAAEVNGGAVAEAGTLTDTAPVGLSGPDTVPPNGPAGQPIAPARGASASSTEKTEPSQLETIPIADSLDFLQDYEKRGQSVFAKFLGKIGRRNA